MWNPLELIKQSTKKNKRTYTKHHHYLKSENKNLNAC